MHNERYIKHLPADKHKDNLKLTLIAVNDVTQNKPGEVKITLLTPREKMCLQIKSTAKKRRENKHAILKLEKDKYNLYDLTRSCKIKAV